MHQLDWLPSLPDFRRALRAAREQSDVESRLLAAFRLCGYNRDFVATEQLDRLIEVCASHFGGLQHAQSLRLTPARIALLASHTVDHLQPAIRVAGLGRRLAVTSYVAAYGSYRQTLLGDDDALAAFAPQFALIASDVQDVGLDVPLDASQQQATDAIAARVDALRSLWRRAREHYGAQVIQQTWLPTEPSLFGSFEALVAGSPLCLIEQLNAAVRKAARCDGVLLLDLAWHAARGTDALGDPVRWYQAKQLVSPLLAPLYGDLVARVVAAALGLSRKCLVLDLDNTLWGGVIGDDGMEGIVLGQGSPVGEAFLAFQRYAAQLSRRGIVLAVCSKNDATVAEAAFKNHPDMLLRREQIAAFVANWNDKATNLRCIAQTLSIGTDSLVFVDDNPAERDIVRRELPEVAVPELPDDPARYASVVSAAGYFECASFTADDVARGAAYAANAQRRAALEHTTDLAGYLRSLEMVMQVTSIGPTELPRATQLINKSNQFNLTTRRYTEVEVARIVAEGAIVLCLRLVDRFGDNGLISVIIARPDAALAPDEWLIDTWLMSCRVLGRQVEVAALDVLARLAAEHGARALIGEYRPTAKNRLVADHYEKLGFAACMAPAGAQEGAGFWRIALPIPALTSHFIALDERL